MVHQNREERKNSSEFFDYMSQRAAGCDRNRITLIARFMEVPVFYEYSLTGMMEIRTDL